MTRMKQKSLKLSNIQVTSLVVLRMVIGWLLLYEGIAKLLIPDWTSAVFLANSRWLLSGVFNWMASNPDVIRIVDLLNIWGLILVGLGLLLGVFTRFAIITGVVLLSLYYIASSPFLGTDFGLPTEGHYLFINKTFVVLVSLLLLAVFPSDKYFAMDRFIGWLVNRKKTHKLVKEPGPELKASKESRIVEKPGRREMLRYLLTIPILGTFICGTSRKYLWNSVNAVSGATITIDNLKLKDLKGQIPHGNIGDKMLSRIIMGGNLIGGWSHARDLIYVSSLFKAYNTEMKVFETIQMAEKAGINTINILYSQLPLINKYKRIFDSNLQTMTQVHPTKDDVYGNINRAIDQGADIIQIQGNCCDWRVRDGEIDVLHKAMEYIRKQGYLAGLGAHSIQALIECDRDGIEPDFFMKTLHHDSYWSAHPRENRIPFEVDGKNSPDHDKFHNNMFCLFPEETIGFMKTTKVPFIAFKVLAAGAIKPEDGFRFAFENGADFICVGMFDYQVVDDVNIAIDTLATLKGRKREWFA